MIHNIIYNRENQSILVLLNLLEVITPYNNITYGTRITVEIPCIGTKILGISRMKKTFR